MSALWGWILLACTIAFATKFAGFLLPARWIEGPRMSRVASLVTVGLLASLVAVNTLGSHTVIVVDARIGALLIAMLLLALRAPFLLVVIGGAAVAAGLRGLGWG